MSPGATAIADRHSTVCSCYLCPHRYVALNTALALYVALVEKDIIYEGKRRTFASRVRLPSLALSFGVEGALRLEMHDGP